jgi:phospholipid transport system substrate-binding protein
MKYYKLFKATLLYLLIYLSLFVSPVWADTPIVLVKSVVDQAINTSTDPFLQGDDKKEERRTLIRQIILPRFDLREMAKRSLGTHWRKRTIEDKNEFIRLFTGILEKVYLDRIESYNNGEKFIYANERIEGAYAEVRSKILTSKGEEFQINYKLHRVGKEWKIYDVVVENISLINNYRSQFNRIITKTSYTELVSMMRQKLSKTPNK